MGNKKNQKRKQGEKMETKNQTLNQEKIQVQEIQAPEEKTEIPEKVEIQEEKTNTSEEKTETPEKVEDPVEVPEEKTNTSEEKTETPEKVEAPEEKTETPELDMDVIIEVGQIISDGHLLNQRHTDKEVFLTIENKEGKEITLTYPIENFIRLAKKFKVIKDKTITVIKNGDIKEFSSINEFHEFLLKEKGKEKINKGLLYNLKNGKYKSCYGYCLYTGK